MKKRTVAILLALVLVFGAAVGGTLAWLTSSTKTVVNTFSVGNVTITLDEAKVGTDGKEITGDGAERVTENSYKLLPGGEYDKDPTVHVDNASEDCYVYVAVKNGIAGIEAAGDTSIEAQMIANGWVKVTNGDTQIQLSTGALWYFGGDTDNANSALNDAIVSAGQNVIVFETIKIDGDKEFTTVETVEITAYAIQSANMTDAVTAWNTGKADSWT